MHVEFFPRERCKHQKNNQREIESFCRRVHIRRFPSLEAGRLEESKSWPAAQENESYKQYNVGLTFIRAPSQHTCRIHANLIVIVWDMIMIVWRCACGNSHPTKSTDLVHAETACVHVCMSVHCLLGLICVLAASQRFI